jgi:hypothetical protein
VLSWRLAASDTDDTLQVGTWAFQPMEVNRAVEDTLGNVNVARRDFGWCSTAVFTTEIAESWRLDHAKFTPIFLTATSTTYQAK